MFDAAYVDYFSGRVGTGAWMPARAAISTMPAGHALGARENDDAGVELRVGATLLRALPSSLHAERMALASACEARLDPALSESLQLHVWTELSCALADTHKQRARQAAEQALRLARNLDDSQADRFPLYHVLARCASAAAQAGDLSIAGTRLDEARALEDSTWPAQRLLWGAEAGQWVARIAGDTAESLARGRRLVALDRERGSLTGTYAAISTGNLIDAELAAGNAQSAARCGADLVEWLRGTRHEYALTFSRINLVAAHLAMDESVEARPVAHAAWDKAPAFDLQHAAAAYLALLAALRATSARGGATRRLFRGDLRCARRSARSERNRRDESGADAGHGGAGRCGIRSMVRRRCEAARRRHPGDRVRDRRRLAS
jgi:hypothetical protein